MALSIVCFFLKVIDLGTFAVFFNFMGPDAHYTGDVQQLYSLFKL